MSFKSILQKEISVVTTSLSNFNDLYDDVTLLEKSLVKAFHGSCTLPKKKVKSILVEYWNIYKQSKQIEIAAMGEL